MFVSMAHKFAIFVNKSQHLEEDVFHWRDVSRLCGHWVILCVVGVHQDQQHGIGFRNLLLFHHGVPSSHSVHVSGHWIG